jgi:hypothetical protein
VCYAASSSAWRRVNDAGNLTGRSHLRDQLFPKAATISLSTARYARVTGCAHKRVLIFINTLPRIPRVAQGIIQLFRNSAFHTLPGAELHRQAIMPGAKPDIPPYSV